MLDQLFSHSWLLGLLGAILVSTITGINLWLFTKIESSCTRSDVEKMIDAKLDSKIAVIDIKLDGISRNIDLILKNAHLEFSK